jgi:hypothetical protein
MSLDAACLLVHKSGLFMNFHYDLKHVLALKTYISTGEDVPTARSTSLTFY